MIIILYLSLHCHHQVGRDENHFNVSINVRDKVTRQRRQTITFEEKVQPKLDRTEVPLLTSLIQADDGNMTQY